MGITINGKQIDFTPGETVLQVARRAGIHIPHLCSMELAPSPAASCRLCLVEVQGMPRLMTSCTLEAREGMVVQTHSPRVLAVRRNIVELLVASHPRDCLACSRSKSCELLKLSSELGVREHRYAGIRRSHPLDVSSPSIVRDSNKCILCGRCVTMCHSVQGIGAIDFTGRGYRTSVQPGFHGGLNVSGCVFCGQCVRVCPTGALREQSHLDKVIEALGDPNVAVVAQVAPAVPATLLESDDETSVRNVLQTLAAALKHIGFHAVFDTSFAADLTIMEEAAELVHRIQNGGPLPMFTSCSPGWIRYVEVHRPEWIPHLSTCKSPQQMAGALIKELYPKHEDLGGKRLVSVSIMPCTAKKAEAGEMGDVDYVLTTRELSELLDRFGIDLSTYREQTPLDSPFGMATGAARLFGGTGGVMEAALRTAYKTLTGHEAAPRIKELRGLEGIKRLSVEANGLVINVAVVNGLGQLKLLPNLQAPGGEALHFIEVMTCPGGCVGGGGQPHNTDLDRIKGRLDRLYAADRRARLRVSHANEEVHTLYETVLGQPLGELSHRLLHRHYVDRSKELGNAEA